MKVMNKSTPDEISYIKKEIKIHSSIDSPFVVKFYDFIETDSDVYVFLEYCENKDLFEYIVNNKVSE
jgi:serine/threonine protein kinase